MVKKKKALAIHHFSITNINQANKMCQSGLLGQIYSKCALTMAEQSSKKSKVAKREKVSNKEKP